MSGIVRITVFQHGPPVDAGFSHTDTVAGLMGACAVMPALYKKASDPAFNGELLDLALFEPPFSPD